MAPPLWGDDVVYRRRHARRRSSSMAAGRLGLPDVDGRAEDDGAQAGGLHRRADADHPVGAALPDQQAHLGAGQARGEGSSRPSDRARTRRRTTERARQGRALSRLRGRRVSAGGRVGEERRPSAPADARSSAAATSTVVVRDPPARRRGRGVDHQQGHAGLVAHSSRHQLQHLRPAAPGRAPRTARRAAPAAGRAAAPAPAPPGLLPAGQLAGLARAETRRGRPGPAPRPPRARSAGREPQVGPQAQRRRSRPRSGAGTGCCPGRASTSAASPGGAGR